MNNTDRKTPLKYLTPENIYSQLNSFMKGMSVSRDAFDLTIPNCRLEDMEWNHMDQMHRRAVHNTYEKGIRIASGSDFAVSLTQWAKWPFFITVTDVYVARGLFYQSLTIAGVLFVHSIISMVPDGDSVKLKHEWYIASNRLFKFLHGFLSRKFYKLNQRLQEEDEPLRQGRFFLRKKGYEFKTNQPDYYNSNVLGQHTIYPPIESDAFITLRQITSAPTIIKAGNLEFIAKKDENDRYLIWPAACPHEGGPLMSGKLCDKQITCPWHGLKFQAVTLSAEQKTASRYGFIYLLQDEGIFIAQMASIEPQCNDILGADAIG